MLKACCAWALLARDPCQHSRVGESCTCGQAWTAHCVDLDLISMGNSPEHALASLCEAIEMMVGDDRDLDARLATEGRPGLPPRALRPSRYLPDTTANECAEVMHDLEKAANWMAVGDASLKSGAACEPFAIPLAIAITDADVVCAPAQIYFSRLRLSWRAATPPLPGPPPWRSASGVGAPAASVRATTDPTMPDKPLHSRGAAGGPK